jgi:hypothetical protein
MPFSDLHSDPLTAFAWNKSYFEIASRDPRLGDVSFRGAYEINPDYMKVSDTESRSWRTAISVPRSLFASALRTFLSITIVHLHPEPHCTSTGVRGCCADTT